MKFMIVLTYLLADFQLISHRHHSNAANIVDRNCIRSTGTSNYFSDCVSLHCVNRTLMTYPLQNEKNEKRYCKIVLSSNNFYELNNDFLRVRDNSTYLVEYLWMDQCNITTIADGAFHSITYVSRLVLSYNQLSAFELKRIRLNSGPDNLYINHNPIKRIENDTFVNMKSLQYLELSCCQISHIENEAFNTLTKLEQLFLNDNRLIFWEPKIKWPLMQFEIRNNPFMCDCRNYNLSMLITDEENEVKKDNTGCLLQLNETFCRPIVSVSKISDKKIECRVDPKNISVDIIWYQLENGIVYESMADVRRLLPKIENGESREIVIEELHIRRQFSNSNSRIFCFARNVAGNSTSRKIFTDKSANVIEPGYVFEEYDSSTGKYRIECVDCQLIDIPKIKIKDELISSNRKSTIVDYSLNHFHSLGNKIFSEKLHLNESVFNIEKMYLRGCQITEIHDGAFDSLVNLSLLDLNNNNLQKVPIKSFNNLNNLTHLDLGSNPIKYINTPFSCLNHLRVLNLSSCGIMHIERDALATLQEILENFNLNVNNLTSEITIVLNENKFSCDCFNFEMVKFFNNNRPNVACNELKNCRLTNLQNKCAPKVTDIFEIVDHGFKCFVNTEMQNTTKINWSLSFGNNINPIPIFDSFLFSIKENVKKAFNTVFNELKIQKGFYCDNCQLKCDARNQAGDHWDVKQSKDSFISEEPVGVRTFPILIP